VIGRAEHLEDGGQWRCVSATIVVWKDRSPSCGFASSASTSLVAGSV